METLHAVSAVLTDWLLETSIHVSVLFALVLGVTALLGKRLPSRWRHALWALVLLRVLLPAIPASPTSVHNVARFVAPPARLAPTGAVAPDALGQLVPATSAAAPVAATVSAPVPVTATTWPWRSTAAIGWMAGALLALARLLWLELRFARRVAAEPPHDDPRARRVLDAVLRDSGVRRRVDLVRTDLGDGPALTGLRRPRILVPGRVLDGLTDDELRHVLAHEVAHLAAGDVLQNWVLALLEALHWFNPLVRVAAARVRTERETLRDLSATKGALREGRAAYGRTLLRLLETGARRGSAPIAVGLFERRGDLRRRIEMIAKGGGGRRAWMMGAGLTAAVAVMALTGASPGVVRADEDETPTVREDLEAPALVVAATTSGASLAVLQDAGPRIEVVRRSEPPEWEPRVQEALAKSTTLNLADTSVVEFMEYMSRVTGLNVVIHPDAQADAEEPLLTLQLEAVSAAQALRLALRQAEMTYGITDGVLHVGHWGQIRPNLDQRFYKIAPLVDAIVSRLPAEVDAEGREDYRQSVAEDLITLCMSFTVDEDSWSRNGVSIAMWGDVIVVEQDAAAHAEVESCLNMLLTRGAGAPSAPAWRTELEKKLEQRVSFDFKEATLASVVSYLAQSTETSIVVGPDVGDDAVLSLKLTDVTTMEAVNWVARQAHVHAAFKDGAVVLTRSPPVVVRAYDVSRKLVTPEGGTYDGLVELIVHSVAPASWEEIGSLEVYDGLIIVKNMESVHAQIEEFLEVARRAADK